MYIFGSLELRRTSVAAGDYVVTTATEVPYLFAHGVRLGRVHYAPSAGLTSSPTPVHLLLELPDSLGSSSIVLDQGTGELVESTTYQGYGGTEGDYRPVAWAGFREDYRFTGKEEDVEVGLQYFGKRYLAPSLGRWISPDPLAVHAPGKADLNLYAYVHGSIVRAVDPLGLQECRPCDARTNKTGDTLARGTREQIDSMVDASKTAAKAGAGVVVSAATGGVGPAVVEGTEAVLGTVGAKVLGGGVSQSFAGILHRGANALIEGKSVTEAAAAAFDPKAIASDFAVGAAFAGIGVAVTKVAPVLRATFGAAKSNDYRGTFFDAHPDVPKNTIVHHAVEQQVLTRYPGVVTDAQIHSLENLRGIPERMNSELHLSEIRKSWNQFYRTHATATVDELLDHATKIDNEVGHLFTPGVRPPPAAAQ